jgi:hypothetical protein
MLLTVLPTHFDGRPILERIPYTMPGELVIPASSANRPFAEGTFLHSLDLPLEVVAMSFQASCLDGSQVPIATPSAVADTLRQIRIRAKGLGKTRDLTKASQLLSSLTAPNRIADNGLWEMVQPYYLKNGQGWSIDGDNTISSGSAAGGVNLAISFKGSLLVLG